MTLLHLLEAWFVLSLLVGAGLARIIRHGNWMQEQLALHLRGLCEHDDNYAHRYEDGRPCGGCYDVLMTYDAERT